MAHQFRAPCQLQMHKSLLCKQLLLRLSVVRVVYAAIDRTDCCTLGFVVESNALGALVWGDVIHVHVDGGVLGVSLYGTSGRVVACASETCSIRKFPISASFVDGVIGAFRFTSSAIDAFVGDDNGHVRAAGCNFVAKIRRMISNTLKEGLVQLGAWLRGEVTGKGADDLDLLRMAEARNGWFTADNVRASMMAHGAVLEEAILDEWTSRMPTGVPVRSPKRIGLVLAGNLPMVGWNDVLCVLLSGHMGQVKCASDDAVLIPAAIAYLHEKAPLDSERLDLSGERMTGVDAIIATGSSNAARHFDHYFKHVPRIIRGNRTSVAFLDGNESHSDLEALGKDVFAHYGLGCRSTTKLFLPAGFDLDRLFGAWVGWGELALNNKYANNYDYHKALWLLNRESLIENGFLLVKEDEGWTSPVGALFISYYENQEDAWEAIEAHADGLQCVGVRAEQLEKERHRPISVLAFGQAQCPMPWDYADGKDTMAFLHAVS